MFFFTHWHPLSSCFVPVTIHTIIIFFTSLLHTGFDLLSFLSYCKFSIFLFHHYSHLNETGLGCCEWADLQPTFKHLLINDLGNVDLQWSQQHELRQLLNQTNKKACAHLVSAFKNFWLISRRMMQWRSLGPLLAKTTFEGCYEDRFQKFDKITFLKQGRPPRTSCSSDSSVPRCYGWWHRANAP